MDVTLQFLGAAGTVTGSKYLLTLHTSTGNLHLLIDCGIFQGEFEWAQKNDDPLPFDISQLDACVLTHAHIDHTGLLPRLVAQGFAGPVHCTPATAELSTLLLRDSAKLQAEAAEEAAERQNGHDVPDPEQAKPLYDIADVERTLEQLRTHPLDEWFPVLPNVDARYRDAGHILGAATLTLRIQGQYEDKTLVFSGDLGPMNDPILPAPEPIAKADILIVESTYGDRAIPDENPKADLARTINMALGQGGVVIIPSFAVGRTQLILYYLRQLKEEGLLDPCHVYIDSPMAISATELYRQHLSEDYLAERGLSEHLFDHPDFYYTQSVDESKALGGLRNQAVIISAGGMATGGRVLHHLKQRLPHNENTILFVGYQSRNTLGRHLLEGGQTAHIHGDEVTVRAAVDKIEGLSAHADQAELMQWIGGFQHAPKRTYLVHGEDAAREALAERIRTHLGWHNVELPAFQQVVTLFEGI